MNRVSESDPAIESSSPHYVRLGTTRTLIGLFGAPAAWIAQIILSEPIAAYVCYPFQEPLTNPIWEEAPAILAAINIACLITALLSDFMACSSWRQTAHNTTSNSMNSIEISAGRTRFLAKLSLMSSFVFTMAVLFNIFAVLLVPLCSSWY